MGERIAIIRGLRRSEPQLDFPASQIPDSTSDPNVLALAATPERVLVSNELKTMPRHFYRFVESRHSPGIILIPQSLATAHAVDELRIARLCNDAAEFENRIVYHCLSSVMTVFASSHSQHHAPVEYPSRFISLAADYWLGTYSNMEPGNLPERDLDLKSKGATVVPPNILRGRSCSMTIVLNDKSAGGQHNRLCVVGSKFGRWHR